MSNKLIIVYFAILCVIEIIVAALFFIPTFSKYDGSVVGSTQDYDQQIDSYAVRVRDGHYGYRDDHIWFYSYTMELGYEVDGQEYMTYYTKGNEDTWGTERIVRYDTSDPSDCVVLLTVIIKWIKIAAIVAAIYFIGGLIYVLCHKRKAVS